MCVCAMGEVVVCLWGREESRVVDRSLQGCGVWGQQVCPLGLLCVQCSWVVPSSLGSVVLPSPLPATP